MNGNLAYQEEFREELIGGELVMMAPALVNHNRVSGNIFALFSAYLKGHVCEAFPDGVGLYLSEEEEYIPDGMVVCDPEKVKPDGIHGAPDLVVEVLSRSSAKYDRGHKKDVYEAFGVGEYWIVDPESKLVEQYLSREGKLTLQDTYALYPDYEFRRTPPERRAADAFRCSLYEDLMIRLEDIFDRVP